MFKRIGIIASNRGGVSGIVDTLQTVTEILRSRNINITFDKRCTDLIPLEPDEVAELDDFCVDCDLVITIGGDGTMLNAAHRVSNKNIPLLGINRGHLGFLADIPAEDVKAQLSKILDGHYDEEERFMLQSQVLRNGQVLYQGNAVNDVILQKWNIARLVEFDTYIDDDFLLTQRSDGMIVSTPTGSTAYALSGGGPIVYPSLDALLLVPICPHTLSIRPIVVDGNSRIKIVVGHRELDQAQLTCDGDVLGQLQPGDEVLISKKQDKIRLIHPQDHDHFSILRAKLNWGR